MLNNIKIRVGNVDLAAELNDSNTAKMIWEALPISSSFSTWGDEIYFSIPVEAGEENGAEVVQLGDLGYWPPGTAFCIFYGRTPASVGDEIRPASAVNIVGKVTVDPTVLKDAVKSISSISIEKAKNAVDSEEFFRKAA